MLSQQFCRCIGNVCSKGVLDCHKCRLLNYTAFFFQAEDGIRDLVRSRGLGDVYKRQVQNAISRPCPPKEVEHRGSDAHRTGKIRYQYHRLSLIHI